MARTAEVKRDARIGEAEARRDAQIKEAIAEEERMASRYCLLNNKVVHLLFLNKPVCNLNLFLCFLQIFE